MVNKANASKINEMNEVITFSKRINAAELHSFTNRQLNIYYTPQKKNEISVDGILRRDFIAKLVMTTE